MSDDNNDCVPTPVKDEITSRPSGDDLDTLLLTSAVRVYALPPPVPQRAATTTSRRYVVPARRNSTPPPLSAAETEAEAEPDVFSLPTRVSMLRPVAVPESDVELDTAPKRTFRGYWVWGSATLLALIASVGVVRATGAEHVQAPAEQPIVAPPPEPVIHTRREDAWPQVGEGPCRMSIVAQPDGATVSLDGIALGKSPVTLAALCGTHRIDVSHPTQTTATVWGSLVEGQPQTVEVTLPRRIDAVWVRSQPAGANIHINGRLIGRTPQRLSVLGGTAVRLEVRKPGYRTVVHEVTTTTPSTTVRVHMRRLQPPTLAGRR